MMACSILNPSRSMCVIVQKDGHGRLADPTLGNPDDKAVELVFVRVDVDSVHFQECQGRCDSSSLVSVSEGMIATDSIQDRRRHFEKRLVEKTTVERGNDGSHR